VVHDQDVVMDSAGQPFRLTFPFDDTDVVKDGDVDAKVVEAARIDSAEKQIYKHGVKITVRGSYADLLQYLTALEKLPTQMFWGVAKMDVVKHPTVELTLTLYTLSLEKTWLQV
jgi:MSHA biogenesis protein MshJ